MSASGGMTPVISLGIGVSFSLLWLAGLRWRYSNLPPYGDNSKNYRCFFWKPFETSKYTVEAKFGVP
jgi:hypothetical protein